MKRLCVILLLCTLALVPAAVSAQSLNGSIYVAQDGAMPELFMFTVSGQTFVMSLLTFGNGGNGRWFAAYGTTDGVSGVGQVINPSGFMFTQPSGASFTFQLDGPGAATGSFTTSGLGAFLSAAAGRFVRVFP